MARVTPRLVTPAMFWLFVVGSCVLVAVHLLFGLIAARSEGLEGAAAAGYALGHVVASPGAPLALVLGVLAARRATRTREHLAVGAVITLGALVLLHGQRVGRDLDRIDDRQREAALLQVGDACRACPDELGAKACDAYCACLRERVSSEAPSALRRGRVQSTLAAIRERCLPGAPTRGG